MKRLVATFLLLSLPAAAGERLLITDVRLDGAADSPRVSLYLEHGRITEVINDRSASLPGVRSYSGEGRQVTPAFIDAWSNDGFTAPKIIRDRDKKPDVSAEIMAEMRSANRKGVRAAFSVASAIQFEDGDLSLMREEGVGTLHLAPTGELLGGMSAVVSAADAAARNQVIAEDVYQCAAFRASGTGYPSTLMGYHAQLRQFFLDSKWEADLRARWDSGRPGPRPAFDPDLREGESILSGERRLLCEANSDDDILRWLRLAEPDTERKSSLTRKINASGPGSLAIWRVAGRSTRESSSPPMLAVCDGSRSRLWMRTSLIFRRADTRCRSASSN